MIWIDLFIILPKHYLVQTINHIKIHDGHMNYLQLKVTTKSILWKGVCHIPLGFNITIKTSEEGNIETMVKHISKTGTNL